MKKAYMAPNSAAYEICTNGMLALSLVNRDSESGGDLGSGDFDSERGGFEICTNKKEGYWDSQW